MPGTELARRDGVELIRTGKFQTLTGSWNPTPADIKAAVDAMSCPAIRKPVIRLGHQDSRFAPQGDGEPALGWFENLRAADDGHTLLADQVTLPWLHQVQAAAYPSRSIEGNYNHRCSEGHVHPFVIHTVALLGVTPPGVQTLRSINDLPEFLGVAASGEVPDGAERVQVTILAAALPADPDQPAYTSAMVALVPAPEDAARLAIDGGDPADQLHLTLAYLGEAADLGAQGHQDVIDAVSAVVNGMPVVDADVFALSVFNPGTATDSKPCIVYGVTGDFLDAVHDFVSDGIDESMVATRIPPQLRPWVAHVTAAFTDDLGILPGLVDRMGPVRFDRIRIAFAGQVTDIPLIDWADAPDTPDAAMVAAAGGNPEELKKYWLAGPGLAKWADKPHPWTALYKALRPYIKDPDERKRTASAWYRLHFGHMPNQKGVKAAEATTVHFQWEPGMAGEALVDAIRAAVARQHPDLPAAEPDQEETPIEEDSVSLSDDMRSRLGLADDADETAALAAIDALKAAAEKTPEPTPEMVAASAAAAEQAKKAEEEKDELRKEVEILASQMKSVSDELAATKAEKAATVKASVLDAAIHDGKIKPADRETWEKDYDEAPAAVTRVLASLAVGTAVPVMASGSIGDPEPSGDVDAEYARLTAAIDMPTGKAV